MVGSTVIGHTRKATTGAISIKNTHPFHCGKIVGAHNGFVYNHKEMNVKHKREHECDSPHIFDHINAGLPLGELDAAGTVSYVHLGHPDIIYLGRGFYSDLSVHGIGPAEKPLGIVWGSVHLWVKEALQFAGFKNTFEYETQTSQLYSIQDYLLYEVGEFLLKAHPTYIQSTPHHTPSLTPQGHHNSYGKGYDWQKDNEDKSNKFWEKYRQEKQQLPLTPAEAIQLSDTLKKTGEILYVAAGEAPKVTETIEQCTGCRSWGPRLSTYANNGEGIVYDGSIDQTLCHECHLWWGSETMIPALREGLDARFLM